ncbi:Uncharacterised protein [Neisseria sicca]|nr:Uncharacterised protein [Neisseria sicca]
MPLGIDIVFNPEVRIQVVQFAGRNMCIAAGLYFSAGIGQQYGTSRCLIVPIQRAADIQTALAGNQGAVAVVGFPHPDVQTLPCGNDACFSAALCRFFTVKQFVRR